MPSVTNWYVSPYFYDDDDDDGDDDDDDGDDDDDDDEYTNTFSASYHSCDYPGPHSWQYYSTTSHWIH